MRDMRSRAGRFPYGASGMALGMGEADGFVKTITDADSGDILGVHIVGVHASTLIHEAAVAIRLGASAEDICAYCTCAIRLCRRW